MTVLLLLAFFLIQVGVNWWFSSATLLTIWLFITLRKSPVLAGGGNYRNILLIFTVILMFVSMMYSLELSGHDFLRTSREALVLVLYIYSATRTSHRDECDEKPNNILNIFLSITLLFVVVAFIQFISLKHGQYIGFPNSFFGSRGSNLPTALDLQYSHIRPSGFYTEPSYFGLMFNAIQFIVSESVIKLTKAKLIFVFSIVGILLTQSKLGLLFSVFFLVVILVRNSVQTKRPIFLLIIAIVFFIGLGSSLFLLILHSYRSSESFSTRFAIPFKILPHFLLDRPLGIPFYHRIGNIPYGNNFVSWQDIADNSIFTILFSYGFVGILVLILIYQMAKSFTSFLLITCFLLQNGSFLDLDKCVLLIVALTSANYLNDRQYLQR